MPMVLNDKVTGQNTQTLVLNPGDQLMVTINGVEQPNFTVTAPAGKILNADTRVKVVSQ